jgi:biofilm PGA synthesis N-glycosyltransferase PgaC
LITAARDEAVSIEMTIRSVIAQTSQPLKWVIVSDGSTDGTDDVVTKYCDRYNWIELIRMQKRSDRHFAGKAEAFNTGFAHIKDLTFDLIGNVDADLSFDKDFFAFLVG